MNKRAITITPIRAQGRRIYVCATCSNPDSSRDLPFVYDRYLQEIKYKEEHPGEELPSYSSSPVFGMDYVLKDSEGNICSHCEEDWMWITWENPFVDLEFQEFTFDCPDDTDRVWYAGKVRAKDLEYGKAPSGKLMEGRIFTDYEEALAEYNRVKAEVEDMARSEIGEHWKEHFKEFSNNDYKDFTYTSPSGIETKAMLKGFGI